MTWKVRHGLLIACASMLLSCQRSSEADLIIYNASIYTVDSSFSTVEAMAIKGGKLLETGTSDEINRLYKATETLDLEGQFVYPGFNDAHSHFMGYAATLRSVNLVGTQSYDEVIERIQEFQAKHQSDFITGRGWDQNDWEVKEFPNKQRLDELFPDTPIFIRRIDGHAALANQAALDFAGIDEQTEVAGGVIVKDENGITGVLVDNAMSLVKPPRLETNVMADALKDAQTNLFEVGLTTVTDAGLERYQIELLDSLLNGEDLSIRLYAMVSDNDENLEHFLSRGKIKTDWLNVGSFKFYMDGALGSRGALLLKPYADDSLNYGLQLSPEEHYHQAARKLREAGWQMCVHAIGDSANRLVLDVFAASGEKNPDLRWRIEHCQILDPVDISRFGEIGAIPSVQPTHATSDMYWAEDRLGAERMTGAYSYQDLLGSAGVLPLGTDFPIEGIDPLKTFYSAVFRQDTAGFPKGGFLAEQKLTRQQALTGITRWPAYAAFEESEKGSLEAGKWADFVVLNMDILEADQADFEKIAVQMTFLGGKLVYQNKESE